MNDPQIVCEVLATKLAFLKNNQQDVPQSLYILIAQLLQYKLINLNDIYCWVSQSYIFKELHIVSEVLTVCKSKKSTVQESSKTV